MGRKRVLRCRIRQWILKRSPLITTRRTNKLKNLSLIRQYTKLIITIRTIRRGHPRPY